MVAPPEGYDSAVRLEIFDRLLRTMKPGRLLDLGAGHGAFAEHAAKLGWQVTAVDARTERFPWTEGIEWIEADLREYPIGKPDVICLLGVLYHLELGDQIELLKKCAGTPTILDTHVTGSATVTIDGYDGWFFEEELAAATASWGNERSFWPTRVALRQMLADCGYSSVLALEPDYYPNRTFYLCL